MWAVGIRPASEKSRLICEKSRFISKKIRLMCEQSRSISKKSG
jgi:hypothetical protein